MASKALFVLLLVPLVFSLDSASCKEIKCGTTTSGTCANYDGTTLTVAKCNSGYSCSGITNMLASNGDLGNLNCVLDTASTIGNGRGHNMSCNSATNCASGTCTSGKCVGKADGSTCIVSEECTKGSYCSGGTCTARTLNNGDSCTSTYQCPPGSGCNSKTSTCTKNYSLSDGTSAGSSRYCKSMLEYNDVCTSIEVRVNGAVVDDFKCTIGQTCDYYYKSSGTSIMSMPCLCKGVAGSTDGYCYPYLAKRSDFSDKLQWSSSDCSGSIVHYLGDDQDMQDCDSLDKDDMEDFSYETTDLIYYGIRKSGVIDDCAKDLGTFDPDWDSAAYLALGLLAILNLA